MKLIASLLTASAATGLFWFNLFPEAPAFCASGRQFATYQDSSAWQEAAKYATARFCAHVAGNPA